MDDQIGEVIVQGGPAATFATVVGYLDLESAPTVGAALAEAVDEAQAPLVVVDLSAVSFLGSTGMTMMLETWARAADTGAKLCLVTGECRAVLRPLRMTGLDQVIPTFGSLAEVQAQLGLDITPGLGLPGGSPQQG